MKSETKIVKVTEDLKEDLNYIRDMLFDNRKEVLKLKDDMIQQYCIVGGYNKESKKFDFKYKEQGAKWHWYFSVTELELGRVATGYITELEVEVIIAE